jgi:MFS family permease
MTAALLRLNQRTFSSLRYRNYRLFFAGQIVSQTGSWMQRIALGWFVLQLTHSAFAVGVMALAQFLPFTVFGLFAGVLTDRLDARRLVMSTQAAQLATAVALAVIAMTHIAQPWMLYLIAFLNGLVLVLDVPSRQQLTYRMVGREALPNAIALNASLFNASRIFGPAFAGMLYGFTGAGVCFLVNALSFFAVLISLFAMRTRDFYMLEEFERPSILRGTLEGLAYVRTQPRMMLVIGLTLVIATFSFNFNVTLPVLAYSTLHTDAAVYGILSALFGAGALVGALSAAALGRASTKVMIAGSLLFTGSELLLAPVHSPVIAGTLLFFTGAGFTAWSANANTQMQLAAPEHMRGRIIGIYFYAFNGTGPAAGLLAGWLCAKGGTQLAFIVAGAVGLAGTAAAAVRLHQRREPGAPRTVIRTPAAGLTARR